MPNTRQPRCIFLNGLPGSGKSTHARRLVARRPAWLNLDVDIVRGLLGSARDFVVAGIEVRPLAMALLETQVSLGRNVIVPQLFIEPDEASDFEEAALEGGALVTRVLLDESVAECWRRVRERAGAADPDSLDRHIFGILESKGGPAAIESIRDRMGAWQLVPDPPACITPPTLHAVLIDFMDGKGTPLPLMR